MHGTEARPIFTSDDIQKQLPGEAKRFQQAQGPFEGIYLQMRPPKEIQRYNLSSFSSTFFKPVGPNFRVLALDNQDLSLNYPKLLMVHGR